MSQVKCDMVKDCAKPVSHIDSKGYVYCDTHGLQRKIYAKCRKLKAKELETLKQNKPIAKY